MNYKIKITADNRETVKRIADENGMNPHGFQTFHLDCEYPIKNGEFDYSHSNICYRELTTEQFIELFDKKKETELEKWLRETKAKNLSYIELREYLYGANPIANYTELRSFLGLKVGESLLDALYDQWNTQEQSEWKPKRGERVLVWNEDEKDAAETVYVFTELESKLPYLCVSPQDLKEYKDSEPYYVWSFKHMKPIPKEEPKPIEKDFKTKVVELVDKKIEICKELEVENKNFNRYNQANDFRQRSIELTNLLQEIKELN